MVDIVINKPINKKNRCALKQTSLTCQDTVQLSWLRSVPEEEVVPTLVTFKRKRRIQKSFSHCRKQITVSAVIIQSGAVTFSFLALTL